MLKLRDSSLSQVQHTNKHIKGILDFCCVFCYSVQRMSLLTLPICSCMLFSSSVRAFSTLIIVVLNSESYNFNMPAIYLSLVLMLAVSSNYVLVFSIPYDAFLNSQLEVVGTKSWHEQAFTSVREAFCNSVIRSQSFVNLYLCTVSFASASRFFLSHLGTAA